jgi:DNA-binding CsgD family transcriptional regulator
MAQYGAKGHCPGETTMPHVTPVQDRRADAATGASYETLLRTLGTPHFGPAARDAVMAAAPAVRRIYLFEAAGRDHNAVRYFFGEQGLADLFPAYRRWYLRQDPVWDACRAAPHCGDVALQTVRAADLPHGDFRRRVFDDAGIVERVSVIQRGPAGWRGMNVARHASSGVFSQGEIHALVGLACLMLPMIPLHRERHAEVAQLSVAELEQRFARRFASLTARERQVCARAAAGLDVAATALELGIGKSSVLTYRQRAYQRLSVASPVELLALVTH